LKFRIQFIKSAAKSLKKLPTSGQKRIGEAIDGLSESLPNPDTTKLKGNNPFHKLRVGNYRIIYEIQEEILVVLVVKIGHRRDVYKNIT
jgi:mRNA interferase RelE/StbE